MSEPIVTEKAVFAAADQLQREQDAAAAAQPPRKAKRVSVRNVREILGGGSHEDIAPILARWRELRKVIPEAKTLTTNLPELLAQVTQEAALRFLEAARVEAKKESDAAATLFAGKAAVAAQERDSALTDCAEADAELSAVRAERDSLSKTCGETAAFSMQLQHQLDSANARASAAELRESEIRKRTDDLKAELDLTHGLHQAELEQVAQLRAEISHMRVNLDQVMESASKAMADASTAQSLVSEVRRRADDTEAKGIAEIKAMAAECEAARHEAREQAELVARLRGELGAVQRKADDFLALIKNGKPAPEGPPSRGAKANAN